MSVSLPQAPEPAAPRAVADDRLLYAVEEDARSALRMAWLDPALRSVAASPVFFIAAWSATRPNVTRSFVAGAERLRRSAVEGLKGPLAPPVNSRVRAALTPKDEQALVRTVQALHHGTAKVYLVIQAWAALARRGRIPGTGREEPPAKRGVPEWQADLHAFPRHLEEETEAILDDATMGLGLAASPTVLQAISAWPTCLAATWQQLKPRSRTEAWRNALISLRRVGTEALRSLPHPMELQWDALARRGLTEDRRASLADHLTAIAGTMPASLLTSAYLWVGLGCPDMSSES